MESVNSDRLFQVVCTATHEVFSTMLGLEVTPGQARFEPTPSGPVDGVISLIGFAGEWVGMGGLSLTPEFACRLSSRLLMTEFTAVDAEVLDAVAELTNMILGNVKSSLEEELGAMGLSIPTVVFGKNFTARSTGRGQWVMVPFTADGGSVEVRICLAPNGRRKPMLCPANPVTS